MNTTKASTTLSQKSKTFGSFEPISLPAMGIDEVIAKVDTGAFSGALHCSHIKVVRRGPLRKRILTFIPFGKETLKTETDMFQEKYVRSTTGHRVKRFIIETDLKVQGETYRIKIGLADRSDMRKPVLIGRRFLREHNILVDVRINQEYDDEGERIK